MTKEKIPNTTDNHIISDIVTETDYRNAKAKLLSLQRKRSWKLIVPIFLLSALIISFILYCFVFGYFYRWDTKDFILSVTWGFLASAFFILYLHINLEITESSIHSKIIVYEANILKETVTEDIFDNSIKMSYKYLDQYYLQTKQQAQKGFLATMIVAGFGALLIAGGIIAMFFGSVEPSYVTCGAGVITEFIAAVFFYLYNKTVSSMSTYHNKLVLSHNVSIALKVAESLPEDNQVETKKIIITELLKDINSHIIKEDSPNVAKQ